MMFRPAFTSLSHALVVCDLAQIPSEDNCFYHTKSEHWLTVSAPLTELELCLTWPSVTPPTLLELWRHGCKVQSAPPPQPLHAYSYIQQSGRSVKIMNAKYTKKSPIHGNADANITCDFGDGDISRCRSQLPHGQAASHVVSSIIVRYVLRYYKTCDM